MVNPNSLTMVKTTINPPFFHAEKKSPFLSHPFGTVTVTLLGYIWVNFITTSHRDRALESWLVCGKSSPAMAELFRLVNYYNLLRYMNYLTNINYLTSVGKLY